MRNSLNSIEPLPDFEDFKEKTDKMVPLA